MSSEDNGIKIQLFDSICITENGEPILESLSNTRKTKLFISYLLINRDRIVPHKELFELLWSGQEYSNPGTALRTLLYRFRNLVADSGHESLEDVILSKRGAYQWNSDIGIGIDIYDFEDYSRVGLNEALSKEKRMECLKKAIDLYKGPLMVEFNEEHWLVPKSVHYRDLYIMDVDAYVTFLKEDNRKQEIRDVLETALIRAGHNDLVDLELGLISDEIDEEAKDRIKSRYDVVAKHTNYMSDEVDKLQKNMEADDVADSAFVCDYEMFKEVYHLQRRLLARTGETMYAALITVGFINTESVDSLTVERVMKSLLDSTKKCLRCGDSICRYSDLCLAVMFPAGAYEDARKILERIRSRYLTNVTNSDLVISYRIRPLKNTKD